MIVQSQRLLGELGGTPRRGRAWGEMGLDWFLTLRTNHTMYRGASHRDWLSRNRKKMWLPCPWILEFAQISLYWRCPRPTSTSPHSCVPLLGLTSLNGLQGIQGAHSCPLTAVCHCLSHLPWTPWLHGPNSHRSEDTVEKGDGHPSVSLPVFTHIAPEAEPHALVASSHTTPM